MLLPLGWKARSSRTGGRSIYRLPLTLLAFHLGCAVDSPLQSAQFSEGSSESVAGIRVDSPSCTGRSTSGTPSEICPTKPALLFLTNLNREKRAQEIPSVTYFS